MGGWRRRDSEGGGVRGGETRCVSRLVQDQEAKHVAAERTVALRGVAEFCPQSNIFWRVFYLRYFRSSSRSGPPTNEPLPLRRCFSNRCLYFGILSGVLRRLGSL